MFLPWYQMIILGASLLTLNPLFITLNTAFVSPPHWPMQVMPYHISNSNHILTTIQQQSSLSLNTPSAQPLSKWTGESGWTDGKEEGTVEAKRQADSISAPRLLLLKAEVKRVVGNCRVFH